MDPQSHRVINSEYLREQINCHVYGSAVFPVLDWNSQKIIVDSYLVDPRALFTAQSVAHGTGAGKQFPSIQPAPAYELPGSESFSNGSPS